MKEMYKKAPQKMDSETFTNDVLMKWDAPSSEYCPHE